MPVALFATCLSVYVIWFLRQTQEKALPIKIGRAFICLTHKQQWRRRRDSDFFSYANKIKELASNILVKIAQGHQKGHQKILKELTITNNELVKRVYRKRDESQFCQTSMMPFFTSSPVSLLKNALCELRQSLSRRSSAYVRDQCSSQWLIACELSNGLPYKALLCT